ncbi:MAG: radical SAM protein [Negativicutes bacterium]
MFTILRSYFDTPYLYDASNNDFFQLDENSFNTLVTAGGKVSGCTDAKLQKDLIEAGVSDEPLPVISVQEFTDKFNGFLNKTSGNIGKITFSMTERCNLRCKYCIYSGNYENERVHATAGNDLTVETANKALDHFLSQPQKPGFIIFYGGEALLNFPVLQHMVERTKKESPDTGFSITTNALLLNEPEKLDYLINNNFMLNISFDGPQQETARVDHRGHGTYARLLEILQTIYDRDKNYFNNNVVINIVLSPMHSLLEIKAYFDEQPLFAECTLNPIFNYDPDNIYAKTYGLEQQQQTNIRELEVLRHEFATDYTKASPFLKGVFLQQMQSINQRFSGKTTNLPLHSCCLPGKGTMFVNSHGALGMCERAEKIILGTVDDFSTVEAIAAQTLETYRSLVEKHCTDCWANKICTRCFATVDRGDLGESTFIRDCERLRKVYERQLQMFLTIKEQNESALDELENYSGDPNELPRDLTM